MLHTTCYSLVKIAEGTVVGLQGRVITQVLAEQPQAKVYVGARAVWSVLFELLASLDGRGADFDFFWAASVQVFEVVDAP